MEHEWEKNSHDQYWIKVIATNEKETALLEKAEKRKGLLETPEDTNLEFTIHQLYDEIVKEELGDDYSFEDLEDEGGYPYEVICKVKWIKGIDWTIDSE